MSTVKNKQNLQSQCAVSSIGQEGCLSIIGRARMEHKIQRREKKIKPSCDVNEARKSRPQSYFVRTNTDCTVCPIGFIYHMLCSRNRLISFAVRSFFFHFVHFVCVCSLCLFEFSVSIHRIRRNSFSLFTFDKYVL